ncbi:[3-methyl-2-oxobutanoate dehydrogenase [lipoamide]] kinase, mitochondrial OS=Bos taurus GN=BCKDK PE=2 SV=1 [Rhizoctonia solani AG-1 IB]|uniref:Protein-serine/threonine kinase n=1 Tax=Thanatephorus cucumeris (strain AG1-IB / isolate 7/3/14) TaxID=1108050 RepID=A0A0B7F312_THACB|nr:[3-methyl-2-oxobutanoate dehydrogenase [lipoamide]] kinase, mitochondrial OS=Bos taurus GN=BCKDK PE=2 SV=1 [Rhizoctonia solani AG-1 IB]
MLVRQLSKQGVYPKYVNGYVSHARVPGPNSESMSSLLSEYERLPPRPIPLKTLRGFANPPTPESVLESASYVLTELPRRLVQRVRALDGLPFIVGMNPFIMRTHKLYHSSFERLATFPEVKNLEDNDEFSRELEKLVEMHSNDIPTIAKGFQECSKYLNQERISSFLDLSIRGRIAVRLIAEQHIALSRAVREHSGRRLDKKQSIGEVGVASANCVPADMVRMCAAFVSELCEATLGATPPLVIDGIVDTKFTYVPVHIEYILTEILKNSYRATVEHHQKLGKRSMHDLPPVTVTIAPPMAPSSTIIDNEDPAATSDKDRSSGSSPSYLSIRVRDEGGGVPPTNLSRIFSYAFTTAGRLAQIGEDDGGPYAAQHIGGAAAMGGGSGAGAGNVFGEIAGRGLQTGMGTIAGLGYG